VIEVEKEASGEAFPYDIETTARYFVRKHLAELRGDTHDCSEGEDGEDGRVAARTTS